MTRRARIAAYGFACTLVLIGVVCAVAISGGTGEILATAFIGVGLVGLVSLVFLEVGLSEDRQLAREREARDADPGAREARERDDDAGAREARKPPRGRRPRVPLRRMRGHPRRLR